MSLPPFEYLAPVTVNETVGLLARLGDDAALVAGGTEIIGRLKQRLIRPSQVISLRNVYGMSGIRREGGELVIGAMTSLREVARSPVISGMYGAICAAADAVGAPPIQNIGTLGGNLLQNSRCLYYNQSEFVRKAGEPCVKVGGKTCLAVKGSKKCFSVYQGDMAPVLIAAGAQVGLVKNGASRLCTVAELFTGAGESPFTIAADELLTEVRLPISTVPAASSFKKLRLRGSLDYPLASASVFLSFNAGSISDAAIVIGACGPSPVAVSDAAEMLKGGTHDRVDVTRLGETAVKMVQAADNLGMPGPYRRRMIKVLTERALREALDRPSRAGA